MLYASDILRNVQAVKETPKEQLSVDAFRGTVAGMGIGAVCGAVVGHYKKWSLLWCAFAGSLAGGVASRALVRLRSKE